MIEQKKDISGTKVEKEAISGLHFPDEEVLLSKDEIKVRASNLERAMKLGNIAVSYTHLRAHETS